MYLKYKSMNQIIHIRSILQVLEAIGRSPFLVGMYYAFQTEAKLYLILGKFQ